MSDVPGLKEWGREVLRPAREKKGLTRGQIARACGIAESTLRNIECGAHLPTGRILRVLCPVVGLPNPLGDFDALTIRLDDIPVDRAVEVLRMALREFVGLRANPAKYAADKFPLGGVLQIEAEQDATAEYADGAALLASLRNLERNET